MVISKTPGRGRCFVDGSKKYALRRTLAGSWGQRHCYRCLVRRGISFGDVHLTKAKYCSVPVSKLPQLIQESQEDLGKLGLVTGMAGHVGDGNFHAMILFSTNEEFERAKQATDRIVNRAIELDGTCMMFSSVFQHV